MTEKPIADATEPVRRAGYGALYGDTGLPSMLNALRAPDDERRRRQRDQRPRRPRHRHAGARPAASSSEDAQGAASSRSTTPSSTPRSTPTGCRSRTSSAASPSRSSDYVDTPDRRPRADRRRLKSADEQRRSVLADQLTQANERLDAKENASEGAVRGDGDCAAERADAAGLAHRASSPRCRLASRVAQAAAAGADYRVSTHPSPSVARSALSAYTASQLRCLQAAEHPHRHSRPARRDALRRLPALPATRPRTRCARATSPRPTPGCARAEAIIDELHATLDMEKGGVVASRLQGIYVFCSRHLLEARVSREPEKIDKVVRAARRAARRLGSDRRRLMDRLGRHSSRSRNAERTLGRRGPLGRARRFDGRARPARRHARRAARRRAPRARGARRRPAGARRHARARARADRARARRPAHRPRRRRRLRRRPGRARGATGSTTRR